MSSPTTTARRPPSPKSAPVTPRSSAPMSPLGKSRGMARVCASVVMSILPGAMPPPASCPVAKRGVEPTVVRTDRGESDHDESEDEADDDAERERVHGRLTKEERPSDLPTA